MKFRMVFICLLILISAIGATPYAIIVEPSISNHQSASEAKIPDTEVGKRFAAYVAAFNLGDEKKMLDFFTENVSKEALERRSAPDRLQIYRQMRSNLVSLSVRKIAQATESSITAVVQSGGGETVTLTFDCEPQPPHKLMGIRVEQGEPSGDNSSPPPTAKNLTEPEAINSIDTTLADLAKKDDYSGVALVAKDGKPVFEKAYGLASQEYKVPNRLDTKFNLGSINKVFTQIAIGQLIEQGKISLDDHVNKFLPDYANRDAAAKVTVRQLLTMTSGIGDFFGSDYEGTPKDRIRNLKDYMPFFAGNPLAFEPGMGEQYSNGGYIVLGLIIEKVTGGDYYEYVREHVFRPTGMQNTDFFDADVPVENLASGYTRNDNRGTGPRRNNIYTRPAKGSSAGGGYSTAEDMLKFANALHDRKLKFPNFNGSLPAGQRAGMVPAGPDGMGIAGGAPGINAALETGAAGSYVVVVMSNYDPPSAVNTAKEIRQILSRISK